MCFSSAKQVIKIPFYSIPSSSSLKVFDLLKTTSDYCDNRPIEVLLLTYTCIDLSLISMFLLLVQIDGVKFSPQLLTCSMTFHCSWLVLLGNKGFFSLVVASCRCSAHCKNGSFPRTVIYLSCSFTEFCLPYED